MGHEMVSDQPSFQNGRELEYGGLHGDAKRSLTAQEIRWNDELIRAERRQERAASTRATPAAATAPALGSESVGPVAMPVAAAASTPGPGVAEQAAILQLPPVLIGRWSETISCSTSSFRCFSKIHSRRCRASCAAKGYPQLLQPLLMHPSVTHARYVNL